MGILVHVLLTAVAVWVATLIPGIDLEAGASTPAKIGTLIGVALLFGLVNAVVKPLVKFFGCLFYLVTLGLIGLVVNALLFWLTGWLAERARPAVRRHRLLAGVLGRDHRRPHQLGAEHRLRPHHRPRLTPTTTPLGPHRTEGRYVHNRPSRTD